MDYLAFNDAFGVSANTKVIDLSENVLVLETVCRRIGV